MSKMIYVGSSFGRLIRLNGVGNFFMTTDTFKDAVNISFQGSTVTLTKQEAKDFANSLTDFLANI